MEKITLICSYIFIIYFAIGIILSSLYMIALLCILKNDGGDGEIGHSKMKAKNFIKYSNKTMVFMAIAMTFTVSMCVWPHMLHFIFTGGNNDE